MKLYYSKGACSLAPRIIINELNLPCEFESVDFKTKKTEKNTDFLSINAKAAVPVLLTDDNQILTENAVILQYLARHAHATQLLPEMNYFEYYRVLEWLNFVATDLHKGCGVLFNPKLSQEVKDEAFIPILKKKLDFVELHFEITHNKFLHGNAFTLPDAYICVVLFWLGLFKIDIKQWPNLSRYFDELQKRPSVAKAFQDEGIVLRS